MFYKYINEYLKDPKEGYKGIFLMLGVLIATVGIVALTGLFGSWSTVFWDALVASDMALYTTSIQNFVMLTAGFIGISVLKDYLVGVLEINWRNWLTTKLLNKYTADEENNYLDLVRHPKEIENPAQRIQADVKGYVKQSLLLGSNLFQAALTICLFIGQLWVIGGALTISSITIPGYLVWVALLYSAAVTLITNLLGSPLAKLNNNQKNLEAEFRSNLELISNDAPSIEQEHGRKYYQESLKSNVDAIKENSYKILGVKINLTAFNSFYQQISGLIPYMLAAPLLFSGIINVGQLMEIGFAFAQIQLSLSWFSDSYESLAHYKTNAKRIAELENCMSKGGLTTSARDIRLRESNTDELSVHNLDVAYPANSKFIMRNLNLSFNRGENTLIKGRSGLGKSTLFSVMSGSWKYGRGEVSVADFKSMCFLPQRPSLPNDTLKAVLAYPDPVNTYTDDQYEAALRDVGDLDSFIELLDTKAAWSKRLSPGQQQRISFARALLKKPDWLFLDEATASLDPENEERMYSLVRDKLTTTTFVSIAHRPSVSIFHNRVITLDVDEDRNVRVNEGSDPERQCVA